MRGVGKIDGLEVFDAKRHARAFWAWADIVALVEQVTRAWTWNRLRSGAGSKSGDGSLTLTTFPGANQQMETRWASSLMDKPAVLLTAKAGSIGMDKTEKDIKRKEGIIQSMTPLERREA